MTANVSGNTDQPLSYTPSRLSRFSRADEPDALPSYVEYRHERFWAENISEYEVGLL